MDTQLNFSTAFHPQIDGQTERVNQILEDMLMACAFDFTGAWDSQIHLMEFAYNNSYQATIAQSRQKNYADNRRKELEFKVGDHVFLKVASMKGIMRFKRKGKFSPRFIGPLEILERIGQVAYRLALPPTLSTIHNVFHVSMLRKYVFDPSHVVNYEPLQISENLEYEETPVCILAKEKKSLRNREISLVKVLWRNQQVKEATWEREEEMKDKYPYLFKNQETFED
ncbi:uncharacterized protein LOC120068805, partial [Benincasa hispida]|uniref:uncharacterized protein LOC120068805 n=1 Tax=Benincasa hispida TaxID=102211 RepID=UPI0018FFF3DC